MRRSMSSLWWPDSNQTASGKPGAVQFDASASTDPNPGGAIVSYDWDFGDGVNIAARLQEIGEAGGVVISRNAHDEPHRVCRRLFGLSQATMASSLICA